MKIYIVGSYAIAPNFDAEKGVDITFSGPSEKEYFQAIEPEYKEIIDPKLSRRMARIIKMGVAASSKSLAAATVSKPEAIVVGTGLGCLQDTEKFLADIIENNENLPSPTAFIQSTHNTIAGQIALVLNCYAHNFTFVQRGHSFECALEDAFLQLEEGADNVLVGGVDEITPTVFDILNTSGCVSKPSERSTDENFRTQNPVMGEGASFFVVSNEKTDTAKACIEGMDYFYNPDSVESIEIHIMQFLESLNLDLDDISAVMVGKNESQQDDKVYTSITNHLFAGKTLLSFKNICGEYFTATSFGVYLASEVLYSQKIENNIFISGIKNQALKNILLYNHNKGNYHTLILLSGCQSS